MTRAFSAGSSPTPPEFLSAMFGDVFWFSELGERCGHAVGGGQGTLLNILRHAGWYPTKRTLQNYPKCQQGPG